MAKNRHFGCRIMDDLEYKGMRTVFLENELLRVGILLDKGADIFQFLHKPSDTDFLWHSPNGITRKDRYIPTTPTPGSGFLDFYHGGWQEILPGGGPATYRGAELGLHGEVCMLGWEMDILEDSPHRVSIAAQVDCIRTPFSLRRVMTLESRSPVLFIEETLTNRSPEDQEYMWGHHPAFGAPFLQQGVRLITPARSAEISSPQFLPNGIFEPGMPFAWPNASARSGELVDLSTIPGPQAGYGDLIYLKDLTAGWFALLNPETKIGFGLSWPLDVFPYLWFWLVYGKAPGYPWWDQAYCVALEPWTSIPNNLPRAIQAGTQAVLKGGGQRSVTLCAAAIAGKEDITSIDLNGTIR